MLPLSKDDISKQEMGTVQTIPTTYHLYPCYPPITSWLNAKTQRWMCARLSCDTITTNCCSTGSKRSHLCNHLPNNVENYRLHARYSLQWAGICPPKLLLLMGDSGPHWRHGSTGPPESTPERHLHQSSCCCRAYSWENRHIKQATIVAEKSFIWLS